MKFRVEKDELGEMKLPQEVYYGIHTARCKENFQIAKRPICRQMIKGLAIVKKAAALANCDAGLIDKKVAEAISLSCDEIINGRLHGQFVTDLVQGGAGFGMNMNANEVIANRANEMLGSQKGKYDLVNPIDHVNLCQSTNDVIPTAGKIATIRLTKKLLVEMKKLCNAYYDKAEEYKNVITIAKTHLVDSVPITFGQVFEALAVSIERNMKKIEAAMNGMLDINMGGTVVGTGLSANSIYSKKIVKYISQFSGENFKSAKNMIDSSRHLDDFVWMSSSIKAFALDINKAATDLRLMTTCYKTVVIPQVQAGSTTTPGKVAPVIPEMINQVVYYIEGNDLTICRSAEAGELELNVNIPIILACLFENLNFVRRAIRTLREGTIEGLTVISEIHDLNLTNNAVITGLLPIFGVERTTEIVMNCKKDNISIVEYLVKNNIYDTKEIMTLFDFQKNINSGFITEKQKSK